VIALESENAQLKNQAIINKDIAGQLKQLKGVLDLAGRGGYQTVSARVIGRGSDIHFLPNNYYRRRDQLIMSQSIRR
jgi:hypothetical protein